jgi:hypothetical protein
MPEPEMAAEGVFAEEWLPLGDGHAPWSHWQGTEAEHNGNGRVTETRAA